VTDLRWRRGRLLVAAPHLDDDPNFHRAVVLVLEHADEGALGIVLSVDFVSIVYESSSTRRRCV
jgi:putative transcriptional regulator